MKSHRRSVDENRVEDFSGENWDDDVVSLLQRDGESKDSAVRVEPEPPKAARKENDLSRANLTGASLNEAHLNGAELMLAQLSHAELRKAHLSGAHLSYANLTRADLRDANLRDADLSFADLSQCDLRGADMTRANLESADLRAADLRGTCLQGVHLIHTKFAGAIFDSETKMPLDKREAIKSGMVFMESDSEDEKSEIENVDYES